MASDNAKENTKEKHFYQIGEHYALKGIRYKS